MPDGPNPRQGTLYDWTFQQWSWAAGHYGIETFETAGQVEAFRRRWDAEQNIGPGPGLIDVPGRSYPTSPRAAYQAFSLVRATR